MAEAWADLRAALAALAAAAAPPPPPPEDGAAAPDTAATQSESAVIEMAHRSVAASTTYLVACPPAGKAAVDAAVSALLPHLKAARERPDAWAATDGGVLTTMLPALVQALEAGVPVDLREGSDAHKARSMILELLVRAPASEATRGCVGAIASAVLTTLRRDSEDNGVLAVRAFLQMMKHARLPPALHGPSVELLHFLADTYAALPAAMTATVNAGLDTALLSSSFNVALSEALAVGKGSLGHTSSSCLAGAARAALAGVAASPATPPTWRDPSLAVSASAATASPPGTRARSPTLPRQPQ